MSDPAPWRVGAVLTALLALWIAASLPGALDPALLQPAADADPAYVEWIGGIAQLAALVRMATSGGMLVSAALLLAGSVASALGKFGPVWVAAAVALACEIASVGGVAAVGVFAFASGGEAIPARHDPDVLALFAAIGAGFGTRMVGSGLRGIALIALIRSARRAGAPP